MLIRDVMHTSHCPLSTPTLRLACMATQHHYINTVDTIVALYNYMPRHIMHKTQNEGLSLALWNTRSTANVNKESMNKSLNYGDRQNEHQQAIPIALDVIDTCRHTQRPKRHRARTSPSNLASHHNTHAKVGFLPKIIQDTSYTVSIKRGYLTSASTVRSHPSYLSVVSVNP